ncbi:cytochrome c-550 PedF [Isoalcanivorax beigongshangi]|uniref:Cytochrome c-550 PedF n=1 Tax=Isoalcanivorax beigongshangi TaxID=3238810 RepID=A0ABV4AJN2_9GAMM
MKKAALVVVTCLSVAGSGLAFAHGDVVPQPVNTAGLTPLGDTWLEHNPYRKGHAEYEKAVDLGKSAYNQNCAACHGLEAKSGGIAPDLRELESGDYGDEWFKERVINGAVRDDRVMMPKMANFLNQEALWSIRAWLETVALDNQ